MIVAAARLQPVRVGGTAMHDNQDNFHLFNPADTAVTRVSHALHARHVDRTLRRAEDMFAFLQRRLAADRQLVGALSRAATIADRGRIWAAYCQEAMRDYAAQSDALSAEMMTAIEASIDDAMAAGKALQGEAKHG